MPCRIELTPFEVTMTVGCRPEEKAAPQTVRFSVRMEFTQHLRASETDQLTDTMDSDAVRDLISAVATQTRVLMLERLARILEERLSLEFSRFSCAWELTIHKPQYGWTYVHEWKT